ncbi:MAG TPA: protein-disulfide reductase DsbD [Ignavibacteriales bacterium]|nr:protein-disulfide reductase DsbD [Ignavibacteriales bacterium]HPP33177.1 protein-disulfide reductase DsbD [Ignavibacteriales bacterium]
MVRFLLTTILLLANLLLSQEQVVSIQVKNFPKELKKNQQFEFDIIADIEQEWHINSNKPNEDYLIPTTIAINPENKLKIVKTIFPRAHNLKFSFSDVPVSVFEGRINIKVIALVTDNISKNDKELDVILNYQACNNQTCLAPNSVSSKIKFKVLEESEVISSNNVTENTRKQNDSVINAKSDIKDKNLVSEEKEGDIEGLVNKYGIILSLVFIFLGGLALNLTPCVYPLIPITISYFGSQSEGKTSKLFTLGVLYVLGMALMYSVVGVVTALTGALFGNLMQNPIVIVIIASIFVTLSLSMFGVYEFQLPQFLVNKAGGAQQGYWGTFFMGLTMGIVAAPCIGPFVLGLVTYVAAMRDPFLGFIMFFTMSIGLGLPYLVLALFSGKITKLPKSGEWMESVKHIFGLILLIMAIYFIRPLLPVSVRDVIVPITIILGALLLLIFDKLGKNLKTFYIIRSSILVLMIIIAGYFLIPEKQTEKINWVKYDEIVFTQAKKENKKIIIDVWADWCIPCKEFENITFKDPSVIAEMKNFVNLKVDFTNTNSEFVKKFKESYNIVGVPTIIFYNSNGKKVKRITGYMPPEKFLQLLKEVK